VTSRNPEIDIGAARIGAQVAPATYRVAFQHYRGPRCIHNLDCPALVTIPRLIQPQIYVGATPSGSQVRAILRVGNHRVDAEGKAIRTCAAALLNDPLLVVSST